MQVQHARMMAASLELGVNIVDVLRLFQAAAQQRVSSAGRRSLSLCAPRTMHERHAWVIALNCWGRHLESRWNNSELFYYVLGHDCPAMMSTVHGCEILMCMSPIELPALHSCNLHSGKACLWWRARGGAAGFGGRGLRGERPAL